MSSARYGSLILTGLAIFGVISWFKTDVAILGWDQTRDIVRGMDHVKAGDWPIYGSEFAQNIRSPGGGFILILTGILSISYTFSFLFFCMGLFAAGTLLLMTRSARILYGKKIAVMAFYMGILSPWLLDLNGQVYSIITMPFFAALFFLALVEISVHHSRPWAIAIFPIIYFASSVHLQALSFVIVLALTWAFTRPRISIKWLILSAVLGLAIFLPFFLDSVKTDFTWFKGLSNLSGARRGPDAIKAFQWIFLFGTNEVSDIVGRGWKVISEFYFFFSGWTLILAVGWGLSILLCFESYRVLFWKSWKILWKRKKSAGQFGISQASVIIILFSILGPVVYKVLLFNPTPSRHMLIILPAIIILLARMSYQLWYRRRSYARVLLPLLFLSQVVLGTGMYYWKIKTARTAYWRLEKVIDAVAAKYPKGGFQVYHPSNPPTWRMTAELIGRGNQWNDSTRPFIDRLPADLAEKDRRTQEIIYEDRFSVFARQKMNP